MWVWNSFGSGKNHKLVWKFDENEDQTKMYQKMDEDMAIQNLIDDGMTKQQAEGFYLINKTSDKNKQNQLVEKFFKKTSRIVVKNNWRIKNTANKELS